MSTSDRRAQYDAEGNEIRRPDNDEENAFCVGNLFYCFYFPFVCRKEPLIEKDIPYVATQDSTVTVSEKFQNTWFPLYEQYAADLNRWIERQDNSAPRPKIPSLLKATVSAFMSPLILLALAALLLATALSIIQPTMLKGIIAAATEKQLYSDTNGLQGEDKLPIVYMIIVILCPFGKGLFEGFAYRIFYHFGAEVRAALCCTIYRKVNNLSTGFHPEFDSGNVLALISADICNIADYIPIVLSVLIIPLTFIVPFIILLIMVGLSTLMVLAVVAVLLPPFVVLLFVVARHTRSFLVFNDVRTQLSTETIEGIKVVKFSGVEGVFMEKIAEARKEQIRYSTYANTGVEMQWLLTADLTEMVCFCIYVVYVFAANHTQTEFTVELLSRSGYISIMTMSIRQIRTPVRCLIPLLASFNRIGDFLCINEGSPATTTTSSSSSSSSSQTSSSSFVSSFSSPRFASSSSPSSSSFSSPRFSSSSSSSAPVVFEVTNGTFQWNPESDNANQPPEPPPSDADRSILEFAPNDDGNMEISTQYHLLSPLVRMNTHQTTTRQWIERALFQTARDGASASVFSNPNSARRQRPQKQTALRPSPFTLPPHLARNSQSLSASLSSLSEGAPSIGTSDTFKLRNLSFTLRKGTLTVVVGETGCGKSSLASALLGDMPITGGNMKGGDNNMRIAYYSQTPWIISGTVRDNITLSDEGEEGYRLNRTDREKIDRFNRTAHICALETDLNILPAREMTWLAEKGGNLSGGQKARIQLARCVYSDSDFYLLDDPFAALDMHVSNFIFEECLLNELRAKGKTILLMTNQMQFVSRADHVIVLKNGSIAMQGPPQEVKKKGLFFPDIAHKQREDEEEEEEEEEEEGPASPAPIRNVPVPPPPRLTFNSEGASMISEEEQQTGSVPWSAYFSFFSSLTPIPLVLFVFLYLQFVTLFFLFGTSYWQGVIGSDQWSGSFSFEQKLYIYGILILVSLLLMGGCSIFSVYLERHSESVIHERLLTHVMKCPVAFFDTTPTARIINRFTGDLNQVDLNLSQNLLTVFDKVFSIIAQVVIIAIDTPLMWAVGGVTIIIFFVLLQIYVRAALNCQRIESMARSSVLSLFSECLNGAGTRIIRIFHLHPYYIQKLNAVTDHWTSANIVLKEGEKWVNLYASVLASLLFVAVTLLGWYQMHPAKIVVATSAALSFGSYGLSLVSAQVEVVKRMAVYQRILQYSTSLPQEVDCLGKASDKFENLKIVHASGRRTKAAMRVNYTPIDLHAPVPPSGLTTDWPARGKIEFVHVSYRYRPGLPYALKDVSFVFNPGEKIGVCGRTGAGKSSLIYPLFRLVELDPRLVPKQINKESGFLESVECDPNAWDDGNTNRGNILIDGIDISLVPLNHLRSSLAIIPQDPTLFTGSLRDNLDLSGKCSDDEIWQALDLVSLKKSISDLPKGLETEVTEGGKNFSCGQRQLICFTRALLQKSKIVLMDEATANMDNATDQLIQNTIKNVFKEQTMIVVAHRLNTIIHSDKILVMDKGHIAEFDSPARLLANPDSEFSQLYHSHDNSQ